MEELLEKIKELMVSDGITVLELPTYEWNPKDEEADFGNGEYLYRCSSNYDSTEFWNTYVRRVKIVGNEVRFDLEEVYENTHDTYESMNWYENEELSESEDAIQVLKNILWGLENK